MNPSLTCLPWLFGLVILPLPRAMSAGEAPALCTALANCSAPDAANSTTTCWGGGAGSSTCNSCPAVSYQGQWYPQVDMDQTRCGAVCTKPRTPEGFSECGAIYGTFNLTSYYCEDILNLPGYTSSPSSYKTVTGAVFTFSAVCKTCDPYKPNAAGTGCDTPEAPGPAPVSAPPATEGPQTCTTLADCYTPLSENYTTSCWFGFCDKCPILKSGNVTHHFISYNTTSCVAECTNPLTPAGVAECADVWSTSKLIRYCDSTVNAVGYTNATTFYKTQALDVVKFTGFCRRCQGDVNANAAGTGCDYPAPAPGSSPVPNVPSVPSCDATANCSLPAGDRSGICFANACYTCPAFPKTDLSGYVYQANRNGSLCGFACTMPDSPDGTAECKSFWKQTYDLDISGYFCKSIKRIPGYPSSPWTYEDSTGLDHRFTGVCWPCDGNYTVNAAGDGCIADMQATPSPPVDGPKPAPSPLAGGGPSTPIIPPTPALGRVPPPPSNSSTTASSNTLSPPPPGTGALNGSANNGTRPPPSSGGSPRVGRGFATWTTTVMALVFASATLAATS